MSKGMYRLLPVLLIAALLSSVLPHFLAPVQVIAAIDDFTVDEDTYLREDEDYEHDEDGLAVGVQGPDGTSRTVLEFDINWGVDIPPDATIVEAILTLVPMASSGDAMTLRCQRLKKNFAEASADWSHYSGSLSWDSAGADGPDDYTTTDQATAYYSGGGLPDEIEWDVTDIVDRQQQYDEVVLLRIVAATETAYDDIEFYDKEGVGTAPSLTIQYSYEAEATYPPTVTTGSYSDITNTTAKLYGEVTYVDNGLAVYDDFEWGSDGDPLDDSGGNVEWTISTTGGSTVEIDDAYDYGAGAQSALLYRDSANPHAYFAYAALGSSETLSFRVRKDSAAGLGLYHGNGAKAITCGITSDEEIYYLDGVTTTKPGETVTADSWNLIEITDVNWASGTYDIYLNDWWICTADMRSTSSWSNKIYFYNVAGSGSSYWLDNVGLKPYVAEQGFQYGLTQTPTWSASDEGLFGIGEYDLTIESLSPGTQYWYRAFATNEEGTAYGSWAAFTTLSAPSITTVDASNVAATTARLNAALADDGGDPCTVKFGWGLTSQSAVDDYDSTETLAGTYSSGSYPYLDVEGLVNDQTYYFRVSATNDAGTTEGSELSFNTTSPLGPPTNFIGYPESTSIALSWSKGTGSTNTLIRYGETSYPTTNTSGTLAYFGTSSTYTLEGLTSGTTYYFSAWGESGGNYSATYATLLMTTSAGTDADDDAIDIPGQPSRWFTAPDYTTMSGLGPIYDGYNNALDLGQVPRETGWMLGALFLSALFGLVAYLRFGKKMLIGMIVLTVCLAMGYFVQLIPWWIPLMTLILTIVWSQTHKQVEHG